MALFLQFAYQPVLKTKPEQTNKIITAFSLFHRAQNYRQKSQLPPTLRATDPQRPLGLCPLHWPHSATELPRLPPGREEGARALLLMEGCAGDGFSEQANSHKTHKAWLDAYTELKGWLGIEKVPLFLALNSLHASLSVPRSDPCLTSTQLFQLGTSQNVTLCTRNHQLSILGTWLLLPCLIVLNCCLVRESSQTAFLCATRDFVGSWLDEYSQTVPKLLIKHPLPGFLITRKVVTFSSVKQKSSKEDN